MKSPELPGFLQAVAPFLSHYGLAAVGVLVFLEDFGVPVPGETILIAAAIYAGAGQLNIVAVGVVGFIAAVLGDNVGYLIGRQGGRRLALRYGRYVFLTSQRLDKAEVFVDRHGGKVITIARFIEGLRQANGLVAGIVGMRWLRFLAWNALGAALWASVWVTTGYFAGSHITAIYTQFKQYALYVVIAAIVVIAALVLWHLRSRWQPWLRRHRDGTGRGGDGRAGEDGRAGNGGDAGARTAGETNGIRGAAEAGSLSGTGKDISAPTADGDIRVREARDVSGTGKAAETSEVHGGKKVNGPHESQKGEEPCQPGDTDEAYGAGIADGTHEIRGRRDGSDRGSEAVRERDSEDAPREPGNPKRL